ncbi:MAG: transposase [Candidatus Thiodiazotropha sp. (ex Lucinoma kastoroae)]|nr:transposase [Candidatus Thiodiazotropha sp. (ex Rostrolucina anterorostrata)]MCU7850475.1 transposase [Candidatus Thiodiazotropha sp. (ex Lucinoma kastoroae)]
MPKPRKALISLEATPYYHCVSRCVRRAFLCGKDSHTGKSFEHRREWIQQRLIELAGIFAIDLCGYAIMSNHVHTLLFIDQKTAENWTPQEVVERWHRLFKGSLLSQRLIDGDLLSRAEYQALDEQITLWRSRLMEIGWFMRCLNEPIARQANKEDRCTGRFWEGRYKSQALLDEKALAACLMYVDLNPVRAGMAETPEAAEFTSISDRSAELKHSSSNTNNMTGQPSHLLPFVGNPRDEMPKGLPFCLTDYIELMDWTGRAILEHKRGFIPNDQPPMLQRLEIDPKHWLYMMQHFESKFKGLVGAVENLKVACERFGYKRTPNLASCQQLLM